MPPVTRAVRDDIVTALRDGHLTASEALDRSPGVVLVGGGPGEPELVTVAARHALATADVVVADRLAPRELLDELGPDVELIDVAKLPRGRSASQQSINEVIVDRARAGKRVVRFKGGDNFVFGRGYEELLACAAADVPVTVVPGLSSAIAVPARVGIPVDPGNLLFLGEAGGRPVVGLPGCARSPKLNGADAQPSSCAPVITSSPVRPVAAVKLARKVSVSPKRRTTIRTRVPATAMAKRTFCTAK